MEKLEQKVVDGLVSTTWIDHEGTLHFDYKQDVEPAAEAIKVLRSDEQTWKAGMKADMVHVLHIPAGVIHELLKIGVNVYRDKLADVVVGLKKIHRYDMCKTTEKSFV